MKRKPSGPPRARPPVALVFGEDEHDREVVRRLVAALRPDAPPCQSRRAPLVLTKGRSEAAARKAAADLAAVVRADRVRHDVRKVFAHEDADAVEPAHLPLAQTIEGNLAAVGVDAIAVVPAWEMETWLWQWPDAARDVVAGWRRPARTGTWVGTVSNAKEAFRKDLRPKAKGARPRDYTESDAPRIVAAAIRRGLLPTLDARSDSYVRFRRLVVAAVF